MKTRFSEEQITSILREAEAGGSSRELCRKHAISDATFLGGRLENGKYPTLSLFFVQTAIYMSHKDWLSRRQRQKQGIERAHSLGKYRRKQAVQEQHQKVLYTGRSRN